jgi:3'-phosphoadenosine 5'-phosphosulfate (PAPS) 3'-phosphatase
VALNPLFLTTAIEAVVRAGDLQMAQFGGDFQIDKKGTIDLVTEVDFAVERMFRAMIAERFPDHQVLAEEMGGAATAPDPSTGPRTTRTPCRFSARRSRSRSTAWRRSRRFTIRRARSCSPRSAAAARS